ncbi:MAG: host attachment protein [Nostocaceae cyanobacterium]|nr:host attachment protein [Nostocaceae cyanobacterium]
MSEYIVAVINGATARFLTLEPVEFPEMGGGPNLIEREDLHTSAKELQGQDLWANVKTGRNRGTGSKAHSYDDHRENHIVEFERRFAQEIANKIVDLTQVYQTQKLLLIAEPQILGLMREALASVLPKNIKTSELAKDLCQLKPNEIHDYLAKKDLVPAYKRLSSSL